MGKLDLPNMSKREVTGSNLSWMNLQVSGDNEKSEETCTFQEQYYKFK